MCVLHNYQNKQRLLTYTELNDCSLKRKNNAFIWDNKIFGRHLDEIQASSCLSRKIKSKFEEISSHSKKRFAVTSYEDSERGGMLGFYPQSDIQHNWAGTAVNSTRRPHFTPRKFLATYLC